MAASGARSLVIYGAGGFARELLELIRDINADTERWELLGFLDDNPDSWGRTLNGLPVLGGSAWLEAQQTMPSVVLGIGSPANRQRIVEQLRSHVADFPVMVHPSVVMSKYVQIGEGVIIAAANVLTANIVIGAFSLLNLTCTVGHDCILDAFVTVSPGVNISGNVRLGQGCDIGTGSKIIQGVHVGAWTIVGAGAVVSKSLPANCTAVGVPAKVIKERAEGWHRAR